VDRAQTASFVYFICLNLSQNHAATQQRLTTVQREIMTANDAYILPPPRQPSVKVEGNARLFAVRRIFCVGRNYADHAREMGHDPNRELPFFFCKPADALVADGSTIPYPPQTKDLQHEVELVVAIGQGGTDIARDEALKHVFGYGVGIDFTRRDLQQEAKDKKRPWDWGKGFDNSAPCSAIRKVATHPVSGRIHLTVNGQLRQDGDLDQMIWPVADVIAFISQSMALAAGDLIYTGTPAGVGPVSPGDTLQADVEGVGSLKITIGR
jgi:fumarylpyruvate hydrolase